LPLKKLAATSFARNVVPVAPYSPALSGTPLRSETAFRRFSTGFHLRPALCNVRKQKLNSIIAFPNIQTAFFDNTCFGKFVNTLDDIYAWIALNENNKKRASNQTHAAVDFFCSAA
jgi:hypothetical protein